jgi:hypothetical protein
MPPVRQSFTRSQVKPGANPMIMSYNASVVKIYNASAVKIYNASAVKIYNATRSQVRFENKQIFVYFHKTLKPTTRSALK